MIRPRLMEQVERAAKLYDTEVSMREAGRAAEAQTGGDPLSLSESYFAAARLAREERLEILRRVGLL